MCFRKSFQKAHKLHLTVSAVLQSYYNFKGPQMVPKSVRLKNPAQCRAGKNRRLIELVAF